MQDTQAQIAAAAARWVVEEGLEYGPAKQRAAQQLGLSRRVAWPDNEQVHAAVREYLDLFCADTHRAELALLRHLALDWMERLAQFRPYLAGAVWQGTATLQSDIRLELYCDDPKAAEIALINAKVPYQPGTTTGWRGDQVPVLSLALPGPTQGRMVGLHVLIYDHDDLRGACKPGRAGRSERGDLMAVRALLQQGAEDV